MNARWAVLVVFYLLLGLLGAWYLSGTTQIGADLETYQRAGDALYTTGNPYAYNDQVPEDYRYRYPPLLAMVIPVLGWPPLWFAIRIAGPKSGTCSIPVDVTRKYRSYSKLAALAASVTAGT